MADFADKVRAESRAYATDEERRVLALEAIADQMRLLVERLGPIGDLASPDRTPSQGGDLTGSAAWEKEGGSLGANSMDSVGIRHSVIDQFEIGGYRYSKLEDAVAEAKRARTR